MDCKGVNVVVLGLAQSGLAAVELLAAKGAEVSACDSQPLDRLPEAAAAPA